MIFYAKEGQDKWVYEILGKPEKGFYLDIGACDGVIHSNSYFFEKLGWAGICVEPNPLMRGFQTLVKNRKCLCLNLAIYDKKGEVEFQARRRKPQLSGIVDNNSSNIILSKHKQGHCTIKIPTITLNQLIEKYDIPDTIDYMSLDTEGSEYTILKTFNFEKYKIKTLTVEHNYFSPTFEKRSLDKKNVIYDLLTSNGYKLIKTYIADDYYVHSSVNL